MTIKFLLVKVSLGSVGGPEVTEEPPEGGEGLR